MNQACSKEPISKAQKSLSENNIWEKKPVVSIKKSLLLPLQYSVSDPELISEIKDFIVTSDEDKNEKVLKNTNRKSPFPSCF